MLQKISNKCCSFQLIVIIRILKIKMYDGFHRNMCLFVFLEYQISNNFRKKDHVTLKTGLVAAENTALQSQQ